MPEEVPEEALDIDQFRSDICKHVDGVLGTVASLVRVLYRKDEDSQEAKGDAFWTSTASGLRFLIHELVELEAMVAEGTNVPMLRVLEEEQPDA